MADGQIDVAAVEKAIGDFADPENGRSVLKFEQVKDIAVSDGTLSLTLELTTWAAPLRKDVSDALEQRLRAAFPSLTEVQVNLGVHERAPLKLGEVGLAAKSVIAIGSGKGGVGKSTIATSVAVGLKRAGCRVGLLDTDFYGPSIPHLLNITEQPQLSGEQLQPIDKDGMAVMSMGLLVPKDEAVIWRGPMLHAWTNKLLKDTLWGELDYLIIDMPPGTGDIALSLSQMLPVTGAVVVCTPQDVALLDAVKAVSMFRTVKIPVLGMVENMSGFVCPDCSKRYDIFGAGGARRRAEELEVPFLGEVPINLQIREHGDAGTTEANLDNPAVANCLEGICYSLVKSLSDKAVAEPPKPQLPVLG